MSNVSTCTIERCNMTKILEFQSASFQNTSCVQAYVTSLNVHNCSITSDLDITGSLTLSGNIYSNHGYYTDYITIGYLDVCLKIKIEDLMDCVKKALGLSCYLYKLYDWDCEKYGILSRERFGLSAQEVLEVFSASVTCAVFDNLYLSVDYDMFDSCTFQMYPRTL